MKFIDQDNRPWEIEINVVTVGRIRSGLKINLLELIVPDNGLAERLSDPCAIVDVLYLLCKEQADAAGVSDIEFGKSMTPDAIEDAWDAVMQGVVNFSPRGMRSANQKILDKAKAFREKAATQIKSAIDSSDFDAMLDSAMTKALTTPPSSPNDFTGTAMSLPA